MISIKFNGEILKIDDGLTLDNLLYKHMDTATRFAVALNNAFVSRTKYEEIMLKNEDQIDIIQPMQGG